MSSPTPASSSTSTVASPLHSSSTSVSAAQSVTAQSMPQPPISGGNGSSVNAFFERWGAPLGGMFLTGIIGYFSALLPLKDNINENKTEISIAKKEIEHVREDVKRMEGDVAKIPSISTDIAVMRTKMEINDVRTKR